MKKKINIMEVCPRDGWQNLKDVIPIEQKLNYIERMLNAGVQYMQICSFVNPKSVPQMSTSQELAHILVEKYRDKNLNALVPNLRGAQNAFDCGLKEIVFVLSASESHNHKNVNKTVKESLSELTLIRDKYPDIDLTMAISTAFGCPFEGEISLNKVVTLVEKGVKIGVNAIELGDTIGIADPVQVKNVFSTLRSMFPQLRLLGHMHDTRNNGILNSWVALNSGADFIHSALGGLGGCPFAPGASGNTCTEDLVFILEKSGYDTGINFDDILLVAKEMHEEVIGNYSGHQINIKGCEVKEL